MGRWGPFAVCAGFTGRTEGGRHNWRPQVRGRNALGRAFEGAQGDGRYCTSNSHANFSTGSPSLESRRAAGVGFLREDGTDGSRGPGLCFTVPPPPKGWGLIDQLNLHSSRPILRAWPRSLDRRSQSAGTSTKSPPKPSSLAPQPPVISAQMAASRCASGRKGAGPREPRSHICAAGVLSATPLTYSMRRDDSDVVVFCFANLKAKGLSYGRVEIPASPVRGGVVFMAFGRPSSWVVRTARAC
jgi:hypothetical protein